jgi:hypothetical protein
MSCTKQYRKKRNTQKKASGGDGTSTWGKHVFGDANSQTRGPDGSLKMDTSYAVQVKGVHGGASIVPLKAHGGTTKSGGKKGGKGVLTDIAVPAVLLYANTMTKSMNKSSKKRNYKNKSRKSRK